MNQRLQRHPYLSMFDGADASMSTPNRPVTITPIQGLFSMNSAFVFERSDAWAGKLIASLPDDQKRVAQAYRTALGRPAQPEELQRANRYLVEMRKELATGGVPAEKSAEKALASYLRVLTNSNEFLFVE